MNYGYTQATAKSQFLDPVGYVRGTSPVVYPGMVAMKTVGELVNVIDATGHPYGLFGNYIGGDGIDELLDSGINACAVWALSGTAEFEVLAPAFDVAQTWTEPTDGTLKLVHAQTAGATRGKLVPAGAAGASARPVGRLIKTVSATKIIIGGLSGTV